MSGVREDADLQETDRDFEFFELIGMQSWLVQKLMGTVADPAENGPNALLHMLG